MEQFHNKTKLQKYLDLLLKWQNKINLISPSTIQNAWERHIIDCAQLAKIAPPQARYIIDIGSGAGLPGIPLAIETEKTTYLIESDSRKAVFLSEALRILKLKNCYVINSRIENAKLPIKNKQVIITARALAELPKLLELAYRLCNNNGLTDFVFFSQKGKNVSRETFLARKHWKFDILEHISITSDESKILEITNLTKIEEKK